MVKKVKTDGLRKNAMGSNYSKLKNDPNTAKYRAKKAFKPSVKRSPFGGRQVVALDYTRGDNLVTGTSQYLFSNNQLRFNLNNLNSPLYTQTTDDPLPRGYDTYLGSYYRFKVLGAKISIEIAPNNTPDSIDYVIELMDSAQTDQATTTNAKDSDELEPRKNCWVYTMKTDKPNKWSRYVSIRQLEGLTKDQFKTDITNYVGLLNPSVNAGEKPARRCALFINAVNNSSTTNRVIPIEVSIRYYVEYSYRKTLPVSKSTT